MCMIEILVVFNMPACAHAAVAIKEGRTLTIETQQFELTYDSDPALGPSFNSANLRIRLLVKPFTTWTPGLPATGNLHGTIRTLDRVGSAVTLACAPVVDAMTYMTVSGTHALIVAPPPLTRRPLLLLQHCEEGFASRDGWVLVDDTLRPRFDTESVPDWTWVKGPRPEALRSDGKFGGVSDLYFFGWGLNHMAAMGDWVKLSGEGRHTHPL